MPDGGTTLTSAIIIGDLAYIAHVGDSRIYLLNKDSIEQLTRDHSLVQRLIELDQLTPEEAADHPNKNMLYRALGQNEAHRSRYAHPASAAEIAPAVLQRRLVESGRRTRKSSEVVKQTAEPAGSVQ